MDYTKGKGLAAGTEMLESKRKRLPQSLVVLFPCGGQLEELHNRNGHNRIRDHGIFRVGGSGWIGSFRWRIRFAVRRVAFGYGPSRFPYP